MQRNWMCSRILREPGRNPSSCLRRALVFPYTSAFCPLPVDFGFHWSPGEDSEGQEVESRQAQPRPSQLFSWRLQPLFQIQVEPLPCPRIRVAAWQVEEQRCALLLFPHPQIFKESRRLRRQIVPIISQSGTSLKRKIMGEFWAQYVLRELDSCWRILLGRAKLFLQVGISRLKSLFRSVRLIHKVHCGYLCSTRSASLCCHVLQ